MIKWVAKKNIDKNYVDKLLNDCIESNIFTNAGQKVEKLENFIRTKFKVDNSKCVVAVTNGSVALHSLTAAISYYENKNINWATQSFTFPSSAQSNLMNVKILDIDKNGGLDLRSVDDSINGIIVTNIFGNCVDISKYEAYCRKYNKYLVFDNAATAYTFYKNKNILNYGNGGTISFHHTKPFGFAEGGAIIADGKYEDSIRCLNNFGIGLTTKYCVKKGNNNKMSEISAIYILQYLNSNFDLIVEKNMYLYKYFEHEIEERKITHFSLFPSSHDKIIVPSCICLVFKNDNYDIYRNQLIKNNISVRRYYTPLDDAKIANEIFNAIMCLPCNIDMNKKDIDKIINILVNTKIKK